MNKNSERHIVEKFISNISVKLPAYSIKNNETPDFIIKTLSGDLSIELTSLIVKSLKARESFQDLMIAKAADLFEKKYEEKLNVFITFSENSVKCSKSKIDLYTNEIFELIEKIYLNNRDYEFTISSWKNYEPINDYIKEIHVDNLDNYANWQSFGAFVVDEIDIDLLKTVISKKEKNIPKYKDTFDKNWLVMVANFGTKSSAHDFRFGNYETINSDFDKIFVYKYFEDTVIEIK